MSAYRNTLYLIGILLLVGSGMAIAGDGNPWSMDDPADSQDPYYDLGGGGASGSFVRGQGVDTSSDGQAVKHGHRPKESTRAKSSSSRGGSGVAGAVGKQNRDEYYGYSGAPPKTYQRGGEPTDYGQFGAFPPRDAGSVEQNRSGTSGRVNSGVQYQGKSFGAFPPNESKARDLHRQELLKARREHQRLLQQRSSGFANVLPPPVPEPVPERAYPYPYSGYGTLPGYGTGYGPGLAPLPGVGGLGTGYGPLLVDPGALGLTMPGLMW